MHQELPETTPPLEMFLEEEARQTASQPRTVRQTYIPIGKGALLQFLQDDSSFTPHRRQLFRQLCRLLEAAIHHEYHLEMEGLKQAYAPLDPDSDVQLLTKLSEPAIDACVLEVFDRCEQLLQRASFVRLSPQELQATIATASEWGLHLDVDFSVFERLHVFARGEYLGSRSHRRWQNFYRPEERAVPTYQRLVVLFRLRGRAIDAAHVDSNRIYLKLFKRIPKMDVDMLLPGTKVRMSWFDQCRILLPTITGLGIAAFKLIKGVVILAVFSIYGVLALLGLIGGTVGYGIRSFFGYLRTKDKYQLNLTRSLYFQNIANNSGVLFRLLDEAEEQDYREAILVYFLLAQRANGDSWSSARLASEAESLLRTAAAVECEVEVHDALRKLVAKGLVEPDVSGGWRAVSLDECLVRLNRRWDDYFQVGT